MREVGLAHLSLLHLDPDAFVLVAAEAGFDFVGLRVRGATPSERIPDLTPGTPMHASTLRALADTGIRVRDIEFLSLDGSVARDTWMPMLEAGAALGASLINVAGQDPVRTRLLDSLALLAEEARGYGLTPALEPISYNVVSSLSDASALAQATGCRVLIDPLHIQRGGSSIADVARTAPELISVVQWCDGPTAVPQQIDVPTPLPRGMASDGDALKLESRALRVSPGRGEFPLRALLEALPSDTALSLEVPDFALAASLGPLAYARRLLDDTRALLADHFSPGDQPVSSSPGGAQAGISRRAH